MSCEKVCNIGVIATTKRKIALESAVPDNTPDCIIFRFGLRNVTDRRQRILRLCIACGETRQAALLVRVLEASSYIEPLSKVSSMMIPLPVCCRVLAQWSRTTPMTATARLAESIRGCLRTGGPESHDACDADLESVSIT